MRAVAASSASSGESNAVVSVAPNWAPQDKRNAGGTAAAMRARLQAVAMSRASNAPLCAPRPERASREPAVNKSRPASSCRSSVPGTNPPRLRDQLMVVSKRGRKWAAVVEPLQARNQAWRACGISWA